MMRRLRELDGVMLFVIITVGLTMISALAVRPAVDAIEPSSGAMLKGSIIYIAVVGWQPLVAVGIVRRYLDDKRTFDDGIRPVAFHDSMFSVVVAVFVLGFAFVIDAAIAGSAGQQAPQIVADIPLSTLLRLLVGFVVIVAFLWLQAIVEELVWRGFILPRTMRTLGAWPGLIVHGVLWGLCYSPLFVLAGDGTWRSLAFVPTWTLLGVLLGWLRLSTRSIYASAASNATLTICAGLPMFLVGESSRFSAALEPPGWLSMSVVIFIIVWHRPWRSMIEIPWRRMPDHVN